MTREEAVVWAMSAGELLAATRELARRSHEMEAELLVHLGELDERKLYLECAVPSLFSFCTRELGFSDAAAHNRVRVARAARRFPSILDAIRSGSVHLWGMRLLVPVLTEANHHELIAQAAGKSTREIEELVVALAPRPPVPTVIRSIPNRDGRNGASHTADFLQMRISSPATEGEALTGGTFPSAALTDPDGPIATPIDESAVPAVGAPLPAQRAERPIVPLSAQSYKMQLTISRSVLCKVREAQDLMRHRIPDGNLESILDAALDVLIEHVKKERFAVGRKPRRTDLPGGSPLAGSTNGPLTNEPTTNGLPVDGSPTTTSPANGCIARDANANDTKADDSPANGSAEKSPTGDGQSDGDGGLAKSAQESAPGAQPARPPSRHIPDAIRRAVFERDGGRCTFVDERGRRCEATGWLETDHVEGFALTGSHALAKIRLLCRAHNQFMAEKMYGRKFMDEARKRRNRRGSGGATSRVARALKGDKPRRDRK